MTLSDLSRRTFLIAGAATAITGWLNSRGTTPAAAAPAATTAVALERPHRTMLGVL